MRENIDAFVAQREIDFGQQSDDASHRQGVADAITLLGNYFAGHVSDFDFDQTIELVDRPLHSPYLRGFGDTMQRLDAMLAEAALQPA